MNLLFFACRNDDALNWTLRELVKQQMEVLGMGLGRGLGRGGTHY